jgi:hypothetical protein
MVLNRMRPLEDAAVVGQIDTNDRHKPIYRERFKLVAVPRAALQEHMRDQIKDTHRIGGTEEIQQVDDGLEREYKFIKRRRPVHDVCTGRSRKIL